MNDIVMKIASSIVLFIPIAIWAFILVFLKNIEMAKDWGILWKYMVCILLANLVQAVVVLPVILRFHGLSPRNIFKKVTPALITAFWSKSSSAALPVTIQCVEDGMKVDKTVARFSLPLCTTINMNACAAFILITVLFVSQSNGALFSIVDMIPWIFIAVIAAIGNAGVPMGCYFLSCALLSYMNIPLHIMGVILPFYVLLDMLESAINVWSDICVTSIVANKLSTNPEVSTKSN